MPRYAVTFDREAASDLMDIRNYIADARGRTFADEFVDRIITFCEGLRTAPHRGTRRDAIRPGLRTITWRRTVTIAFMASDEARTVTILGAFYRGRDFVSEMQKRQNKNQ